MKKTIIILAAAVLAFSIMPITAFAHGHGGIITVNQKYSICNVENCNTTRIHLHNSIYYYGHSAGDGHDYHQLCNQQDCTLTKTHEHGEITFFGHYSTDGHSYHNAGHNRGGRHH